jgi:3-deoxy-D-manno-octulosonate 8-phosphate phosphatase (KDO 8-P phosphatase)
MKNTTLPTAFILDVDGVMTDGSFYYTEHGKVMKRFGPDDNDALSLLAPHLEIRFISGDRRGFPISAKRIGEDMHCRIDLVSTTDRLDWMASQYALERVIYMGDGIFDPLVFAKVGYAIAPANACAACLRSADYVTASSGGNRAVAEATLHILEKFYNLTELDELLRIKAAAREKAL